MILFTHSYFYRFDPKQWRSGQPYPPYGTLVAAATMREAGHEVALFDTNLRRDPSEILPVLADRMPRYLVIYDDGFNYLTKMCLTKMREAAFALCRYGRAHGCTVIVSSSDSTDHYEKYLAAGAGYVLIGEAELTLRELIGKLEMGQEAEAASILGLVSRQSVSQLLRPLGESSPLTAHPAHRSPQKRPTLHDLDSLPLPAWDLVDFEAYRRIWMKHHGYFSLNIATTRGCPYKCNWCAKPIYGNRYNSRSPERVVDEIEMLTHATGVRYFWMSDDIFGLKPGWVQRFRDLVRERGLSFRYKIQSRVDLLLKEDTIEVLADSGLDTVWVGAESGSQKILDAMDKGTTVEEIHTATRLLKKKGVRVAFFLQFGYLGETRDDIEKTIRMVLDLMPHDIGVSVSYPLPGTRFFEKVKAQLGEKQNWTDSDDLAMMYQGTFSTQYYRRLHRYVHHLFRAKQNREALAAWRQNPLKIIGKKIRTAGAVGWHRLASAVDAWRLERLEKIHRVQ